MKLCNEPNCINGILHRTGVHGIHGGCPCPCGYCAQMWEKTWKLTYWPKGDNPYWSFFYLLVSVSGPQPTIDGKIMLADPPTAMWSGCSQTPNFATKSAAIDWAITNGFKYEPASEYDDDAYQRHQLQNA